MLRILLVLALLTGCMGCTGIKTGKKGKAETNTESVNNQRAFENIDDNYIPLKEAVLESDFPEPSMDFNYPIKISCEAELQKGIKSKIELETVDEFTVKINIDGNEAERYMESFEGADIADLNVNDDYLELLLYADGPSMDPSVTIVRYDGETPRVLEIYNEEYDYYNSEFYGYFDGGREDYMPTYGAIWVNQRGRFITSFQNAGFLDKRYAMGCFEIAEDNTVNKLQFEKVDSLLGKHTVLAECNVFFNSIDFPFEEYDEHSALINYNFEETGITLKKGREIEIIDYTELFGYYAFYVDIDGKKGVLTFWLGD